MNNSKFKYFTQLELENVRAFGTKQVLKLTDDNGNPTQWTVLLGDNGVGKTTLLQCFGWMKPDLANEDTDFIKLVGVDEDGAYIIEIETESDETEAIILAPDLQNEYNNDFLKLLVRHTKTDLSLMAGLSNGKRLAKPIIDNHKKTSKTKQNLSDIIVTGVKFIFERGKLDKFLPQGNVKIKANDINKFNFPFLNVYGANRYLGSRLLSEMPIEDENISSRLTNKTKLADAEVILQQLDYAALKNKTKEDEKRLKDALYIVVKILRLKSEKEIKIQPPATVENTPAEQVGVWVKWFSGWVPLTELSLGYKTNLSLTLDIAWQLYQKYPNSEDSLKEPAIVIIDEIDLHLHPKWQLDIMDDLSELFPAIQFIATAHSPLVVQSSPTANFAVLQKQNDEIIIINDPHVVTDWRVDQILNSELFGRIGSRQNEKTKDLIQEKYKLLDKKHRSKEDEKRLKEINDDILNLSTSKDSEDQKALNFINKASDILKKHGVNLDD